MIYIFLQPQGKGTSKVANRVKKHNTYLCELVFVALPLSMRDYKKDLPHQPQVLPENGGFQPSYPTAGSYNHQPQQPTNTVPEYQYSHSSEIASSLIEESSVPGGTPSMQGHARYVEANGQARTKASEGHTTHYNEQQLPVSASYQPSAHRTDWDDEDESIPVAYPVHYDQHGHAPVASIPVDTHVTTPPTGHPIHTSPVNHEHVHPVPDVYGAPHELPSQQPMVQQQPSLPPSTQPLIRQSVASGDPQVPPAKPLQQPSMVSTLSDASKPPDGYPTTEQNRPSPEPQSPGCCCTIL